MAAHKDLTGIDLHEPKGIEDATSGQYYAADGAGSGTWTTLPGGLTIPAGIVVDYAGTSAPSLWLMCYGQAVSRTTYADLFTAIGTTHGTGDGSTTFNLPDYRGRVSAGQDDMGGVSANRLTNLSGGIDGDVLGTTGGSESHTLTSAQMPSHTHTATVTDPGHTHTLVNPYVSQGSAVSATGGSGKFYAGNTEYTAVPSNVTGITVANSTTGSDAAHNNVQPTIIMNKIIYAGV